MWLTSLPPEMEKHLFVVLELFSFVCSVLSQPSFGVVSVVELRAIGIYNHSNRDIIGAD